MAFNPIYGTGWEHGSTEITDAAKRFHASIATEPHTGVYALELDGGGQAGGYYKFPVGGSQSELYIAVWIDADPSGIYKSFNNSNWLRIFVKTSDSSISIRLDQDHYDAYVDGVEVATGSVTIDGNYHHVQLYIRFSNSGSIQTIIEGTEDIDYSGDTLGGSDNTISEIWFSHDTGIGVEPNTLFDDFVYGDDGWPGDLRADPIESVGDTATEEWDLSAGADSWDLLDEVPPSDADYIYSTVNGEQTIVELDAWDATDKTPEFVMLWARAKKDVAAAHQVKIIDDDGSNTNIGDAEDLETNYTYVHKLLPSAPDGFQWTDTKVDTLNIGVESVVV